MAHAGEYGVRGQAVEVGGNRFTAEESGSAQAAVDNFRHWMGLDPDAPAHFGADLRIAARRDLRGKNLCCWCPLDAPCHADVLLEVANA